MCNRCTSWNPWQRQTGGNRDRWETWKRTSMDNTRGERFICTTTSYECCRAYRSHSTLLGTCKRWVFHRLHLFDARSRAHVSRYTCVVSRSFSTFISPNFPHFFANQFFPRFPWLRAGARQQFDGFQFERDFYVHQSISSFFILYSEFLLSYGFCENRSALFVY